jgi:hypothetical protein
MRYRSAVHSVYKAQMVSWFSLRGYDTAILHRHRLLSNYPVNIGHKYDHNQQTANINQMLKYNAKAILLIQSCDIIV